MTGRVGAGDGRLHFRVATQLVVLGVLILALAYPAAPLYLAINAFW